MKKKDIKDATDDGGSDDVAINPVFERQATVDQIVSQHNKQEFGDDYEEKEEPEEPVEDVAEAEEEPAAEEPEPEQPEPEQPEAKDLKKYKIVVDGEEREVTEDEILEAGKRTLQKESKAEKTLQEASELKKRLEEQLRVKEAPPPEAEPPKRDDVLKEFKDKIEKARAEHIKAINYGEEDDVLKAAEEYEAAVEAYNDFKYGNTNKDEIIQEVVRRTKYEDIQKRLAMPPESGGYSDIFFNPYLRGWAADELNKLIVGGEPDEFGTYQKACEFVRGKLADQLGVKKPADEKKGGDNAPTLSERVKKKEVIDNLETASGRQKPPKEKAESPEEIIESMRRNRVGQSD